MTTSATPWDEISTPDRDYNVRSVSTDTTIPLYWGRDTEGNCLFVIELQGNHTRQFRSANTSVQGIKVDLRNLESQDSTEIQRLVLTLGKQVDKDLFHALCKTLMANLVPITDSAAALTLALNHIKRWKAFLAGQKRNILTAEEVRGLFGELLFLRFLYHKHLDRHAALKAWCGFESAHQDFIFGNTAVEVKALSGKERNSVKISSEDQLESLCDHLFLMVYRLDNMPNSTDALSLNDLVHRMETELNEDEERYEFADVAADAVTKDTLAIEKFHKHLIASGYIKLQEYDAPKFLTLSRHAYRVTEDFPRLIRSRLPDGIINLRYELQLEKLRKFAHDPDKVGKLGKH